MKKTKALATLAVWLRNGGRFEFWGWYQDAGHWQVKRVEVRGEDLQDVVLEGPWRRRRDGHRDAGAEIPNEDDQSPSRNQNANNDAWQRLIA